MDFDDCKTAELLGAYLAGDVTDEERAAVESLLAESVCAREERDELRRVYSRSKLANVSASPELMAKISAWAARFLAKKQTEETLGAALTGDVNAAERRAVQTLLADNPGALALNAELTSVVERSKSAQLTAGTPALNQLRERLAARLPQAGLKPRETVTLTRRITPSMRIFLRQENQFKHRLWVGAAAALLLVGSGLGFWKLSGKSAGTEGGGEPHSGDSANSTGGQTPVVRPALPMKIADPDPHLHPPTPETNPAFNPGVLTHSDEPVNTPAAVSPQSARVNTPPMPAPLPVPAPPQLAVLPDGPQNTPLVPPRNPLAPAIPSPSPAAVANVMTPGVSAPNPSATTPVLPPRNPNDPLATGSTPPAVAVNTIPVPNTGSTGGVPKFVPYAPPAAPSTPPVLPLTPAAATIPPVDNAAVVGARQGTGVTVQTSPTNATLESSAPYSVLVNGSQIVTAAGSSMGLVLPKNGRLYVNENSKLTINFSGANTTVILSAGEIYYIAPGSGKLALTAGNDALDNIREANVAIVGTQLNVANFASLACAFVTAKTHGNVAASGLGTSPLDGSGTVQNLALPTPAPGAWHLSVLCPGDGVKQARHSRR